MKNTQVSLLQNIIGTHQDHWRKRAAAMQARTGAAPTAASFCPRRGENKCSSKVTPNNSPNFRVAGHKCEHHRARGTENNKNKTQFISARKVRSGSLRIAMCVRERVGAGFQKQQQKQSSGGGGEGRTTLVPTRSECHWLSTTLAHYPRQARHAPCTAAALAAGCVRSHSNGLPQHTRFQNLLTQTKYGLRRTVRVRYFSPFSIVAVFPLFFWHLHFNISVVIF
jgi:hypothetical protein